MEVHRTTSSCRQPVVLLQYLTRALPTAPPQELRERTRQRYLKCLLFFLTAKPSRASQGQRLSSGMESGVMSLWREAGLCWAGEDARAQLSDPQGPRCKWRSLCTRSEHVGRGGCCGDRPLSSRGDVVVSGGPPPEVLPVKCPHRCPWRLQTVSGDKALVGDKPEGAGKEPRGSKRRLSPWSTDRIIIRARHFKNTFYGAFNSRGGSG